MEQMSIEFISCSFVVSLFVPKLCRFEKMGGSNTFVTDGTSYLEKLLMGSLVFLKTVAIMIGRQKLKR